MYPCRFLLSEVFEFQFLFHFVKNKNKQWFEGNLVYHGHRAATHHVSMYMKSHHVSTATSAVCIVPEGVPTMSRKA